MSTTVRGSRGSPSSLSERSLASRLVAELRRDCFTANRSSQGAVCIGAEVELIPIDVVSHRRAPIVASADTPRFGPRATLPVLRELAMVQGWEERPSPYGAPVFRTRDGGVISYEPGGQIEYSAPPDTSVSASVARLQATVSTMRVAAAEAGIELLAVGMDPYNAIDDVPLQLLGERYTSMDAYFAELGPAGARMMRQTAAMQVTLDAGEDPVGLWRFLSAAAPYVTAIFANSPCEGSEDREEVEGTVQSVRALMWRHLDAARTGLPAALSLDPGADYAAFALRAPSILRRGVDGLVHSFHTLLATRDVSEADWAPHLTTLFPEVRPRRLGDTPTFEVRSADAIEPEWYAAPLVLLSGLAYDPEAHREAAQLLGPANADLLIRAARSGVHDPDIGPLASELYAIGLRGAARLGPDVVHGQDVETACEFGARYVFQGRAPADDLLPAPRGVTDERRGRDVAPIVDRPRAD
jgi:glutamate--cysteine ligase